MKVALVHDYLTQRGGAERVVLALCKAFPEAPVYTSLYEPASTFPEFADIDVRTLPLNRVPAFRDNHRLALPLLAPAFAALRVRADVVLCSSSGWAHGTRANGRKIVYCHAPARWLYQPDRYLREAGLTSRTALAVLRPFLLRTDRRAAGTSARYLANSTVVAAQVRSIYGIEAEVVPPPPALPPSGRSEPIAGLVPGFFLCVSRLLPYKNVEAVVRAFEELEGERLVVVGTGPDEVRLRALARASTTFVGAVSDEQLRWLYASSGGLVAASHEDYGLTPLEAATFGKPSAVLRFGGFLDTVREEETGLFFDRAAPEAIAATIRQLRARCWNAGLIEAHADRFSERGFVARVRAIVSEEAARAAA